MSIPKLSEELLSETVDLQRVSAKSAVPIERLIEIAGGADPSLRELRTIAEALKIPLTDLAPPPKLYTQAGVLFRRTFGKGNVPESSLADSLSRKMGYSLEIMEIGKQASPWWVNQFHNTGSTFEEAEACANTFRDLFCGGDNVSPLHYLPMLLADKLNILLFVLNSDKLEGASAYLSGLPFIFLAARFQARMLLTLAHELGHIVAHHDVSADFGVIDMERSDFEAKPTRGIAERFAHTFAASLLMPRTGVGIVLKKVRELKGIPQQEQLGDIEISYLARVFGVSFEAGARRCEDLDLIPRGGAASLNERIKKDFGSAEKRADSLGLPPRPRVEFPTIPRRLLTSAIGRIQRGELSIGNASLKLGLSITDFIAANEPTRH